MAKYAIYIEFVFSLQSLELLTPTHPQFWTKIWLPLGSQLPVVRVRLGEDHLGCCQPSQLGRSSHLACSRPACPTPGIMRRDFIISLFLDTFEHGKCRETGERQISLKNNFFSVSSHSGTVQQTFVDLLGRALKLGFYINNLKRSI